MMSHPFLYLNDGQNGMLFCKKKTLDCKTFRTEPSCSALVLHFKRSVLTNNHSGIENYHCISKIKRYICYLASPLDFVTESFATLLTFPFKITCKGKGIVIPKTECYSDEINFWS